MNIQIFSDSKVVQALRRLENLTSLVYVSCNPELAMQNFIELASFFYKNSYLYCFLKIVFYLKFCSRSIKNVCS